MILSAFAENQFKRCLSQDNNELKRKLPELLFPCLDYFKIVLLFNSWQAVLVNKHYGFMNITRYIFEYLATFPKVVENKNK